MICTDKGLDEGVRMDAEGRLDSGVRSDEGLYAGVRTGEGLDTGVRTDEGLDAG